MSILWCNFVITFVKVNPSGDWQRGARTSGVSLNRGAGVSREPHHSGAALAVVSRGFGTQDQSWAAPVMPAEAVQLLALIKSSQNHMGASRYFAILLQVNLKFCVCSGRS